MFSLNDKRALNSGFGDGLSRAFEFAATPLVFGALGYAVDRAAGTTPLFAMLLGLFGAVGMFVRLWYGYDAEMRAHESALARRGRIADAADEVPADLWAARKRTGSDA